MSNIHTLDEIKAKNALKNQQQNQFIGRPHTIGKPAPKQETKNEFKGRGRRLDGSYVDPEPEPKEQKQSAPSVPNVTPVGDEYVVYQQLPMDFLGSGLPQELHNDFWSWNNLSQEDITCCNMCLLNYCPCCVGECCSENRKSDWKRIALTFTLYCMLAQLVMYIITLCDTQNINWELEPSISAVLKYGSISTYRIREDYQLWRLITYMFLHGSWFHILFNSMAQFTFCLAMEKSWGLLRYLIIYFATGIIGGLFSSMWSTNKISVGASCAIFGVMGAYCSLIMIYWSQLGEMFKSSLGMWLIMFPIMFICVSFLPNVDFAGHLGGALGGISVGMLVYWNRAEDKYKYWFLSAGIFLIIVCLVVPFSVIYTQ